MKVINVKKRVVTTAGEGVEIVVVGRDDKLYGYIGNSTDLKGWTKTGVAVPPNKVDIMQATVKTVVHVNMHIDEKGEYYGKFYHTYAEAGNKAGDRIGYAAIDVEYSDN